MYYKGGVAIMDKYDVTALGELLIDFTQNGLSPQGNMMFEANPGGAPCNVLAMLTKLGKRTSFIGRVGDDFLGRMLADVVAEAGIGTEQLRFDEAVHTTLAFVHTGADGDRDFSFYRNPGADVMLGPDDVDEETIRSSRLFHFGSLSLTHESARLATQKAVAVAKEAGRLVSFDPNLREPLWDTLDAAREQIDWGMRQCDILKISDNEIQWFTGEEDFDAGVAALRREYDIPLILVSMGRDGSRAYMGDIRAEAKPFIQEHTIETTGAGDTFCACVLNYVLGNGLDGLRDGDKLSEMLTFANAAASIITTRRGALRVMPERAEVEALIAANSLLTTV